jgi:hypothetical protein
MPTVHEYKLSFKSDKHTSENLTYNSLRKSLTYTLNKTSHHSFFCISDNSGMHFKMVYIPSFNDSQALQFEQALKNKDFKQALELSKIAEPLSEGEQPHRAFHRTYLFLAGYIADQEKVKKYNDGFCATHGLRKKKTENKHFETSEFNVAEVAPRVVL